LENYLDVLSSLILITAFILVANKRINSYIKTFRLQSAMLAVVAGLLGAFNLYRHGAWEILIVCLVTIIVKVIYIPHLLETTVKKVEYKVEKDFFLNIPISILICCGLVILSYFTIANIFLHGILL
jgi:hydrogenase-4 component E